MTTYFRCSASTLAAVSPSLSLCRLYVFLHATFVCSFMHCSCSPKIAKCFANPAIWNKHETWSHTHTDSHSLNNPPSITDIPHKGVTIDHACDIATDSDAKMFAASSPQMQHRSQQHRYQPYKSQPPPPIRRPVLDHRTLTWQQIPLHSTGTRCTDIPRHDSFTPQSMSQVAPPSNVLPVTASTTDSPVSKIVTSPFTHSRTSGSSSAPCASVVSTASATPEHQSVCPRFFGPACFQTDGVTERQDICRGLCMDVKVVCRNQVLDNVARGRFPFTSLSDTLYARQIRTDDLRHENLTLTVKLRRAQDQVAELVRSLEVLGDTHRCVICHLDLTNNDVLPNAPVWHFPDNLDSTNTSVKVEQPVHPGTGRIRCLQCNLQIHIHEPCSIAEDPSFPLQRHCRHCVKDRSAIVYNEPSSFPITMHQTTPGQMMAIAMDQAEMLATERKTASVQSLGAWDRTHPHSRSALAAALYQDSAALARDVDALIFSQECLC